MSIVLFLSKNESRKIYLFYAKEGKILCVNRSNERMSRNETWKKLDGGFYFAPLSRVSRLFTQKHFIEIHLRFFLMFVVYTRFLCLYFADFAFIPPLLSESE